MKYSCVFWHNWYYNTYLITFLSFSDTEETKFEEINSLTKLGFEFCSSFENEVKRLTTSNNQELVQLMLLHKNYKRLIHRLDLYKQHEEFEKKKRKKISRKLKKKQFDRIIQSTLQDD